MIGSTRFYKAEVVCFHHHPSETVPSSLNISMMSWLGHLLNVSDKEQMTKREAITVKYKLVNAINAGIK